MIGRPGPDSNTRGVAWYLKEPQRRWRRAKWIDRRIAELDQDRDFAEIMRLSTLYRVDEMLMHWFYAVGTPASGIRPANIDAVYRQGSGTYVAQPSRRRDDSNDHMMLWFEQGPDSAATRSSVAMVNKFHRHYNRSYPDAFSLAEEYVYILCVNATVVHSAMRSMKLPGLNAKQQHATWLFWKSMAELFEVAPTGQPVPEVVPFPGSFDEMLTVVAEFQGRPWPVHPDAHASTQAAVEHFAVTWFPPPLHFFGRALVTTFLPAGVRRVHAIDQPPAVLRWMARGFMGAGMVFSTFIKPDPRETVLEARRRRATQGQDRHSGVEQAVERKVGPLTAQTADHSEAAR